MSDNITDLEKQIQERKKELDHLKSLLEKEKAEKQTPERLLARHLHSLLCTFNHTDACGWFYEVKDGDDQWDRYTHSMYLGKAQKLMAFCKEKSITTDHALDVFTKVKNL